MARSALHAGVDRRGREARALEQLDRVEEEREQQPVDHEAGRVGHLDHGLAERRAQPVRAGARVGARGGGERELDQRHLRDGVEDVQRREALGATARGRQRLGRQRRGGAGEHGAGPEHGGQFGKQRGLRGLLVHDRLDQEADLRQAAPLARHLDGLGVEEAARAPRRGLRARAQEHRAVPSRHGRQAACDRAAPDDPEPLRERVLGIG
jgi:hypothetical protein